MTRTLVIMLLALVSLPPAVGAGVIEGKWGLSAPVTTGIPAELSIIRGTERGAWILDVTMNAARSELEDAESATPDLFFRSDGVNWEVGPRLRRYARPDAEFSPYVDVFVHAAYGRTGVTYRGVLVTPGSVSSRVYGATGGVTLGTELFTPWGVSVAIGSNVVTFAWLDLLTNIDASPNPRVRYGGSMMVLDAGFAPRVHVRAYW